VPNRREYKLASGISDLDSLLFLLSYDLIIGAEVYVQQILLDRTQQDRKPNEEFLQKFAAVVGSKWASLETILCLTSAEMEVRGSSQEGNRMALEILKKWMGKENATHGWLYDQLKKNILFQYRQDMQS